MRSSDRSVIQTPDFHLYITRETSEGWQTHYAGSTYRAVRRDELARILEGAGFGDARWLLPAETTLYQPLVLATAENEDDR